MLANLNTNTLVDDVSVNARAADLLKLWTGVITNASGLNSNVWDVGLCTVTATIVGNWTIIYSPFATLTAMATSGSTSYNIHLKRPSAIGGKDITVRFTRAGATFSLYAGKFDAANTGSDITTGYTLATLGTANLRIAASSAASSLLLATTSNVVFLSERTNYPYDNNSLESFGVLVSLASATVCQVQVSKIFNPLLQNYTPFNPNVWIDASTSAVGPITVSRNADAQVVTPMVALYIEKYENGWAGGDLSTNSDVWRMADNFNKYWDVVLVGTKQYRTLVVGTARFSVADA